MEHTIIIVSQARPFRHLGGKWSGQMLIMNVFNYKWACLGLLKKMHVAVFLVSLLPICFGKLTRCSPPKGEPACVCKTHHGTINLTKLAQNDGTPK